MRPKRRRDPAAGRVAIEPATVELQIDALGAGGEGVGRDADGRVVFVPLAAPGDRLRVRVVSQHARFARGEIESVLEPGPDRVEPRCPIFGRCGGCAWQHVAYPAQTAAKQAILRDALERIGGLAAPPVAFLASPAAYAYRVRARVHAEGGRVGFRARRSREIVPAAHCPQLSPPLDAALAALAAAAPAETAEWELAADAAGGVRTTRLPAEPGAAPRVALRAAGERIEISAGVFAQANERLFDALATRVLEAAGAGGEVLELFAGAGFFTLGLARRFTRVVAVEADTAAVCDLTRNLAAARLASVRVIEARAETVLANATAQRVAPDVVVLDPPRGGIGPRAARDLARLGAHRIVHVSCDPATLARDLRVLVARRWSLRQVTGLDLFPQTPHLEAIAVLERATGGRAG